MTLRRYAPEPDIFNQDRSESVGFRARYGGVSNCLHGTGDPPSPEPDLQDV